MVSDRWSEIEARLGHEFGDRGLLEAALTHRSHANETGGTVHYERLEFLGDAVLGLVAADWLFRRRPNEAEGELSRLKSAAVSAPALAREAERLGLGAWLRLGIGEERSGGRTKASLLADSLEAVFGALYLDGGLPAARRVIEHYLERGCSAEPGATLDAKTTLQELAQGRGWELPVYRVTGETGPDHDRRFEVEVRVGGEIVERGFGRTKKEAQQQAAAAALARLRADPGPQTDAPP